jgi:hypothetical protein
MSLRDLLFSPFDGTDKEHSLILDNELDIRVNEVEGEITALYKNGEISQNSTQAWIGLHPQILQTPYREIITTLNLFKNVNPKKIVDLGAGYGRIGLVSSQIYPACEFVGYEYVELRLAEARRIFRKYNLDNCSMRGDDILEEGFEIPKADLYFVYDFSEPKDLHKLLQKMSERVFKDQFYMVAKGKGVRSIIQNKYPEFWAANGAIHEENWSVYSSELSLDLLVTS